MKTKVRQQVVMFVLAILVLVVMAAPVLAASDIGAGQGEFRPDYLTEKYPPGLLAAEGWE